MLTLNCQRNLELASGEVRRSTSELENDGCSRTLAACDTLEANSGLVLDVHHIETCPGLVIQHCQHGGSLENPVRRRFSGHELNEKHKIC